MGPSFSRCEIRARPQGASTHCPAQALPMERMVSRSAPAATPRLLRPCWCIRSLLLFTIGRLSAASSGNETVHLRRRRGHNQCRASCDLRRDPALCPAPEGARPEVGERTAGAGATRGWLLCVRRMGWLTQRLTSLAKDMRAPLGEARVPSPMIWFEVEAVTSDDPIK